MIIQHNIPAMNSYRNLNNNQNAIAGNLEKLSSGYQINRAGDNAAGLAISEKMRAQITGLDAAQKNVADGISLVKTAEGALQEVHDMLNRMTELATLSANGTFDDDVDRAALQAEVDQLIEEIDRISATSNFNGITLLGGDYVSSDITGYGGSKDPGLSGSAAKVTLQIGDSGVASNQLVIDITSMDSYSLGLTYKSSPGDHKVTNAEATAAQAAGSVADGWCYGVDSDGDPLDADHNINIAVQGTAFAAIEVIKEAINTVSTQRAELGAKQNRLEHTANNLSVMEENIQDAESTIRDTDVAAEMMEYTKNNILIQSSQSMLAQANQLPQGVLQLLG